MPHPVAWACLLALQGLDAPAATGVEAWSSLREGTVVTRCAPGSDDRTQARQALERLGGQIESLGPAADSTAALAALASLLRSPCYRLAVEQSPTPWPGHALALKTWWQDGGSLWLWSYLERVEEGDATDLREVGVLPPDARTVLFSETCHDPRLAPLLCSQGDASCGVETRGWAERARVALRAGSQVPRWFDRSAGEAPAWSGCERQAATQPEGERYTAWRRCVGALRTPERTLPLGSTRQPGDGWLLLGGRRGHYEFCDEVRAFHLATGAAYVAQSCSALALVEGGDVDFAKTDASRRPGLQAGRVLVDNLREAAWMLLMKAHAEDRNVQASTYPLPRGVRVEYRVGAHEEQPGAGSLTWNTSWTTLRWMWTDETGASRATGELTWPTSDDTAEAHAAALLDVAERSLVEGCPPAPLPASLASPSSQPRVEQALWARLRGYPPPPGCAAR